MTPVTHLSALPFTPGERRLLAAFVERARADLPASSLDRILVFGSRARRQGDEDSDLDLAIFVHGEMPEGAHRHLAEIAEAMQDGWEDLPHLRPILIHPRQPGNGALIQAIENDGIELWATKRD